MAGWNSCSLPVKTVLTGSSGLWNSKAGACAIQDHSAETALLPDILNQVAQFGARAKQIAVLLPLSGRTGESAAAIRDGIMAAYYQDELESPELRFYDTGGNAQLIWSVYQQAVADGAEFVIGPLLKDSIQQLEQSGQLPVPDPGAQPDGCGACQ